MAHRWPDSRFPPPLAPPPHQIPHHNPYDYLQPAHPPLHTHISSSSHSLYPNPNPNPNPSYPAAAPPLETFKPLHYSANTNNYPAAGNPFLPHGGYALAGHTPITNLQQHTPAAARHVSGGLGDYYYEKSGIGGGRGGAYLNGENGNEFVLKQAIRQYGADPSHLSTVSSSYVHGRQIPPGPFSAQAQIPLPHSIPPQSGAPNVKSKSSSTTNVFHCNVCNIDCNSKTVFISHEQGKKHKLNLQNLKDLITEEPRTARASTNPYNQTGASVIGSNKKKRENKKDLITPNPETTHALVALNEKTEATVVGSIKKKGKNNKSMITQKPVTNQQSTNPKEKAEASFLGNIQSKRKDNDESEDDLETKKRKVLEAGAEPSEVKVCEICSAVANSQKVFESHLSGSKHIENLKKLQAASRRRENSFI